MAPTRTESAPSTAAGVRIARCARCAAAFGCGVDADAPCWCAQLPRLERIDPAIDSCLCPACLHEALSAPAPR
ncbi:MAG: cysteine-rich CWC family protein [Burkholderiales bacterium]|nr:cysteine-rich CWC family protein [Burkholderiales bacterium]